MSTIEEALQATMAKREIDEQRAAAREEARETIVRHLMQCATQPKRPEDRAAMAWAPHAALEVVLTGATPLADTIKDLRGDLEQAAIVTKTLTDERDVAQLLHHSAAAQRPEDWDATVVSLQTELEAEQQMVEALEAELRQTREAHAVTAAELEELRGASVQLAKAFAPPK